MATESISLNPLSFTRLTINFSNQFRKRRNLSCRIRRSQFGAICSKTSDYQDYQSYARPFRLLPAEEVKVSIANPSFTIEAAFDVFYSQAQPKSNGDMRRLEELFSRYKGNMLFLMCFTVSHSPRYCHVGQELGLYKAQVMLPFNAFGTMAMAREVRVLSLLSFLHN
ncbi:PREDICTED: uncharacterized protein LOC106333474 [Brassica oleracea var. oleracea]|uniref:uncharacterized protein LOC106333474 n=1 Tax=Brassica oleracea var. oleracea TaxID=109376 RepID=UPI0006A6FA67|nr:PREDICTED: uncharacterized protein LOC106333474 [Brassica oleracea var. oleracea]